MKNMLNNIRYNFYVFFAVVVVEITESTPQLKPINTV